MHFITNESFPVHVRSVQISQFMSVYYSPGSFSPIPSSLVKISDIY